MSCNLSSTGLIDINANEVYTDNINVSSKLSFDLFWYTTISFS